MNRSTLVPIALAALVIAAPAAASPCADEIKALDARLDTVAEAAGATSSGGQGVAAARESQAMQGTGAAAPGTPAPRGPTDAQGVEQAARAGGGGDRVMQAKATLNRARTLDTQGDAAGCQGAVAEARRQLGPSP